MRDISQRIGILSLLALLVFGACTKEENTDPTPNNSAKNPVISLTTVSGQGVTGDTTVTAGAMLHFNVNVTKGANGANLAKVWVEVRQGSAAYTAISQAYFTGATYTGSDTFITASGASLTFGVNNVPVGNTPGTWQFRFRSVDAEGNSGERVVSVTVNQAAAVTPTSFTKSLSGGLGGTSCISLRNASADVAQPATASTQVGVYDLYYFYSTTSAHNFVSPEYASDQDLGTFRVTNWPNGNATRFRPTNLTTADFNNATNANLFQGIFDNASDQVIDGWNINATNGNAPGGTRVNSTNVEANDIIAFKTGDGRYGLIRVATASAAGSGMITLDVLVQP